MSGLIWANIGKAISNAGQDIADRGFKLDLMRLEEEKALRLDQIKRDRDIADIPRKAEATAAAAPILAAGEAAAAPVRAAGEALAAPIKARGVAEAAPILAEGEAAAAPIKAKGDAAGQIAKTETPGYLDSLKKETSAKESSATKAAAAASEFELGQKKKLVRILEDLERETDPAKKAVLEERFKLLSGGKYASRYQAVKVTDADGNEVTEILDKQTGFTSAPRRAPSTAAPATPGAAQSRPPITNFNK